VKGAFDVALVGSGFGGSLMAMVARRLGKSVVLVERGRHPRFAIGESSSPLANLLLEEVAHRYGLPRLLPLTKWGSWRRTYPEVACGLKRGFTFLHHVKGQPFGADIERRDQLLVAASPHDEIADTHWYRADFDHFLQREAEAEGAVYLDETRLDTLTPGAAGVELRGTRHGESVWLRARLLIDASGPNGFAFRALALPGAELPGLPPTQALYTHFTGVPRVEELDLFPWGNAPYPPDDAALHHVFQGGWIWVLRFGNGITSAGVAARDGLAEELRLCEGEPAWRRLLARFPTVGQHLGGAHPTMPFVHSPRLPFRAGVAAGPGWALLPSAAAFVDPLLSTGFPLTLRGVERLGRALEEDWGTARLQPALERCGRETLAEADSAALLVGALYASFDRFPLFAALSTLYFAAASYSEAARRLGRPERAGAFLCADHPEFGVALRRLCAAAIEARDDGERALLETAVRRAIAPLDVAGLADAARNGWYPVDAEDLRKACHKLGAGLEEIEALLERCGFFRPALPAR